MPTFSPQALHALTILIARAMGSAEDEAARSAITWYGPTWQATTATVSGMLPAYVRLLQEGLLVPNQTAETVLDAGALLVIDARRGYGQRMAADAVRRPSVVHGVGRVRASAAQRLAYRTYRHLW